MPLKEKLESEEKVEETTVDPAPDQEENTEDSTVEKNDSKQPAEAESSDYAAELDKAKANLVKAEKKIVDMKREGKSTEGAELDLESMKAEIRDELRAELTGVVQQDKLDTLVRNSSTDDDEADLIRFHMENSIKTSGDVAEDVKRAKLLANAHKSESEKDAMREVLQAERTKNTSPNFSGRKIVEDKQPNYTEAEKKLLRRVGKIK